MKNILYTAALSMMLIVASCNFIDSDLNVDPNNPLDVSMDLLLPQAQATWAYVQGGDLGRYASCWTQHHSGFERQHASIEVYALKEADVNNAWDGIYADALKDLDIIIEKAEETNSPHFGGVAKIMTAMIAGTVVDLFGDIPFSDALRGADAISPKYDKAADVYASIQSMLAEAETDLTADVSNFKPGASDKIYGGDLSKWIALSRTLRARYLMHTSKIDATVNSKVLAALSGGIESNDGNAMFFFGSASTEANPWYQFETQRGDVVMGKVFIDLLVNSADPRLPLLAEPTADGDYVGATAGDPSTGGAAASRMGSYYVSSASPVQFVTYAEAKFIEAEAAFSSDKTRSAMAFNDAVKASLAQLGVSDASFEASVASETDATITLEKIMTQKYIACYTTLESFVDWRRTGFPALSPAAGTQVARRFPYPQDERLFNSANYIPNVTNFDRVFWDVN